MSQTTESAFETYVEEKLLTRCGWKSGSQEDGTRNLSFLPIVNDEDSVDKDSDKDGKIESEL